MNDNELEELLTDCPVLYHMAERGSWPSIEAHGLLSTSALLDLYGIEGEVRHALESHRRSASVTIRKGGFSPAVVRDQKPMDDRSLVRCLTDRLAPQDWYRLLNRKVFFWLTGHRLAGLLGAASYRDKAYDVLHVDTRRLIGAWRDRITLCPINSGNTRRAPRSRGLGSFLPIADYPYTDWAKKRRRGERAVELTVDYGIPSITPFVERVVRMQGATQIDTLFERRRIKRENTPVTPGTPSLHIGEQS